MLIAIKPMNKKPATMSPAEVGKIDNPWKSSNNPAPDNKQEHTYDTTNRAKKFEYPQVSQSVPEAGKNQYE